jgi:hypothetical protein
MMTHLLLLLLFLPQQNDGRLAGHVPAAALPGVRAIIARAAQDSIPTEPLVEKALEGGAKGAAPDLIVTAVGTEEARLKNARDLLRRAGTPGPYGSGELKSVSLALARGLPERIVATVVGSVRDTTPGFALHAVADLTAHGFAPDSAAALIVAALGSGLSGHRLLDVSAAADREVQRGSTRAQALARVLSVLPAVPSQPVPRGALQGAVRPRKPS